MRTVTVGVISATLLAGLLFFSSCSTKSQLVGTWSKSSFGQDIGIQGASPYDNPWVETWTFRSDNTFRMSEGTRGGQGKYTVLDNGSIQIEFQGGTTVPAKLENNKLIINWGNEQSVLKKYR